MSDVAWQKIEEIAVAACVSAAVVGVVWAVVWGKTTNEPRYASGIDSMNRPWCQSYDQARPCPAFTTSGPSYGIAGEAGR